MSSTYWNTQHLLVTGGSRGIGRAIVEDLLSVGANVVFTTRTASRTDVGALESKRVRDDQVIKALVCDSTDPAAVQKTVSSLLEQYPITGLVNNAGITSDNLLIRMSDEQWNSVLTTNLQGPFLFSRALAMHFIRQKRGKIVNLSSVSAFLGRSGQTNYAASKAGIIGFTRCLAKELAGFNVQVNAVSPGFIKTDMTEGLPADVTKEIPAKRFGQAWEVARLVRFLLSDDANYVNGQEFIIDGGLSI